MSFEMTHTRVSGNITFHLNAEPDLADEAGLVFDAITKSIAGGQDGCCSVQVGFWPFSLIRSSDGYMVVSPGIQRSDVRSDLTDHLRIMRAQTQILTAFSDLQTDQGVRHDQKIIHHVNIDWSGSFYGERIDADDPYDTGWYFGPLKEEAPIESLAAVWASDLISTCPKVVPYLMLPVGFLLVFGPRGVQTVLDPTDTTVFDEATSLHACEKHSREFKCPTIGPKPLMV